MRPGAWRLSAALAGVSSAADLETLRDVSKLPFSHKADLREHYTAAHMADRLLDAYKSVMGA